MASDADRDRIHEGFIAALDYARDVELWVAARLLDEGFGVRLPDRARPVRRSPDDPVDFSDETDILVDDGIVLEAKGLSYPFTGPADWPFSYGAFTWTLSRWERAERKPDVFVFVSLRTGGIVTTSGRHADQWTVRSTPDRRRPEFGPQERLVAPRHLLRSWERMVSFLRDEAASLYAS